MSGLTIKGISHYFGKQKVIDNASLHVQQGQTACLLGPSGCGKTTLLRIAAGLEPLQKGEVQMDNRTVAKVGLIELSPEQRNVGLMFQDYALFPHLTVWKNIIFGLTIPDQDKIDWVSSAFNRMGLSGFENRYPHELSGGQQQRVALLRALAPEPSVLLLDEAFSGLDAMLRTQVRQQTHELLKETGHTALMVTHDPEEAMFMSDQLLIMNEGRIVQTGTPIEIYQDPINAFVASLFGPINCLNARVGNDAHVETIFGRFAVSNLKPGTSVDILIRPEGFLNPAGSANSSEATALHVLSARPIGPLTHLRLISEKNYESEGTFHARIPGIFMYEPGSTAYFLIDPQQVFIFPS